MEALLRVGTGVNNKGHTVVPQQPTCELIKKNFLKLQGAERKPKQVDVNN